MSVLHQNEGGIGKSIVWWSTDIWIQSIDCNSHTIYPSICNYYHHSNHLHQQNHYGGECDLVAQGKVEIIGSIIIIFTIIVIPTIIVTRTIIVIPTIIFIPTIIVTRTITLIIPTTGGADSVILTGVAPGSLFKWVDRRLSRDWDCHNIQVSGSHQSRFHRIRPKPGNLGFSVQSILPCERSLRFPPRPFFDDEQIFTFTKIHNTLISQLANGPKSVSCKNDKRRQLWWWPVWFVRVE